MNKKKMYKQNKKIIHTYMHTYNKNNNTIILTNENYTHIKYQQQK